VDQWEEEVYSPACRARPAPSWALDSTMGHLRWLLHCCALADGRELAYEAGGKNLPGRHGWEMLCLNTQH